MANDSKVLALQVGQSVKGEREMVRSFVLVLLLASCASHDAPKFGKQVEDPWGWKYTYCPRHQNEIGCENF